MVSRVQPRLQTQDLWKVTVHGADRVSIAAENTGSLATRGVVETSAYGGVCGELLIFAERSAVEQACKSFGDR